MRLFTIDDYSGGLATDLAPGKMNPTQAISMQNVLWDGKLSVPAGRTAYATPSNTVRGAIRAKLDGTNWTTILAMDTGTAVRFYYGEDSFSEIDSSFTATTGADYQFILFGNRVVGVNGQDYPVVIYYEDSDYQISSLLSLDEQVRDNTYWYAGNYDSATGFYTDATTAAQDETPDDCTLFDVANDADGFYIASDLTFNKVTFKNTDVTTGAATVTFKYWDGTAWTAITPTTTPDFTAGSTQTLEFDLPISDWTLLWEPVSIFSDATTTLLIDKYVLRIETTTASADVLCDQIEISNTQYIRQITGAIPPQAIGYYGGRVWLATNSVAYASPYNSITGWAAYNIEVFEQGGEDIEAILGFEDFMLVFKRAAIYGLSGNSYQNFNKRKLSDVGTKYAKSVAAVGNYAFFLASNGYVYAFSGANIVKISKHIHSEIQANLAVDSDPYGYEYEGRYYLCFSNGNVYVFDPDSFEMDKMGDGVVSWFKLTGRETDYFLNCDGADDTGYTLAIENTTPAIYREYYGVNLAGTAIEARYQTAVLFPGERGTEKVWGRIKISVKPNSTYDLVVRNNNNSDEEIEPDYVSATEPATPTDGEVWVDSSEWRIYEYSTDTWVENTSVFFYRFDSGSTGDVYDEEIYLPFFLDEQGVSFEVRNTGTGGMLHGIYFESEDRYF